MSTTEITVETLLVDKADGIALVTVNRPDVRNALSRQVLTDLHSVLTDLRDDDSIGAVVFTGAGEKSFIAGADISQVRGYTMATGLEGAMQRAFDEVEAFEKPTIAAVNGFAHGGGCELAMACDIRIEGPVAVRLAKLVILAGMDTDLRTGQLIERLAQTILYQSDDKVEGTNAFLEKRPPQFRGR